MAAGALSRLLELFEGPEAPGPWAPPAMPAMLHALLPWRAWDETAGLYVNAASVGFVLELPPFAGIDAETLGALSGTLADAAPERCTIQVIHWASPRFGAAFRAWAEPRTEGDAGRGGALARMGRHRADLLSPGGWRRLHDGGPPFILDPRLSLISTVEGAFGLGDYEHESWGLSGGVRFAPGADRRGFGLKLDTRLLSPDGGGSADVGLRGEAGYGMRGGPLFPTVRPFVGFTRYSGDGSLRRSLGIDLRDTPGSRVRLEAWDRPRHRLRAIRFSLRHRF